MPNVRAGNPHIFNVARFTTGWGLLQDWGISRTSGNCHEPGMI